MDGSFQKNVNKCRLPNKKRGKPFDFPLLESGRRGSNPRPSAWKANALSTELLPQYVFFRFSKELAHNVNRSIKVGSDGFEPPKAKAS